MKIYFCDDERQSRERYASLIEKILRKNDITARVELYETAMQLMSVANFTPSDVVILDIAMPQMTGVDAAYRLRKEGYSGEILFLTKSDRFWKDAFNVHAFHYLLKEHDDHALEDILMKAVRQAKIKEDEVLSLTNGYEYRHIVISDIYYFEVRDHLITVYYSNNRQFNFYSQMGKLENTLLSKGFMRVHRSFLVSIRQIDTMDKKNGVMLKSKQQIPIGEKYWKSIQERLAAENSVEQIR